PDQRRSQTSEERKSGSHRTHSGGACHYFGERTRSAPFARRHPLAGAACCQGTRNFTGESASRYRGQCRGKNLRHSRRTQSQCALGQPCARSSVWPPCSPAGFREKGYSKRQRCERRSISRAVGSSVNLLPRKVLYRLILKVALKLTGKLENRTLY